MADFASWSPCYETFFFVNEEAKYVKNFSPNQASQYRLIFGRKIGPYSI
jgi:hypothetical protein